MREKCNPLCESWELCTTAATGRGGGQCDHGCWYMGPHCVELLCDVMWGPPTSNHCRWWPEGDVGCGEEDQPKDCWRVEACSSKDGVSTCTHPEHMEHIGKRVVFVMLCNTHAHVMAFIHLTYVQWCYYIVVRCIWSDMCKSADSYNRRTCKGSVDRLWCPRGCVLC